MYTWNDGVAGDRKDDSNGGAKSSGDGTPDPGRRAAGPETTRRMNFLPGRGKQGEMP
jgi:hypothetical protein